MFNDTVNPIRILNAVKKFLIDLGNKGEVATTTESTTTDWKESLPDDIKADPVFEKYKEPAEAFRALVETQKFLGREKLPVPVDENDEETISLILKRLGHPEKEDGYVLPTDLNIPKEIPLDDTLVADFKKTAHKLGILPKQFSGLYKWYMTSAINAYNQRAQQEGDGIKQTETDLRKEWGAAYGQNFAVAEKVVNQFNDDEGIAKLKAKGWNNDPIIIKMLANIGKVLSEDQLEGKPKGLTMTPDEAQSEISKIEGDMNNPYWKAEHSGHQEAVKNMERLMKLVTAGE